MKVSFIEALTLILITLKLIGEISWSWVYVFLPYIAVTALELGVVCGRKKSSTTTEQNTKS